MSHRRQRAILALLAAVLPCESAFAHAGSLEAVGVTSIFVGAILGAAIGALSFRYRRFALLLAITGASVALTAYLYEAWSVSPRVGMIVDGMIGIALVILLPGGISYLLAYQAVKELKARIARVRRNLGDRPYTPDASSNHEA